MKNTSKIPKFIAGMMFMLTLVFLGAAETLINMNQIRSGGALNPATLNNIFYVDGTTYATLNAAVTAANTAGAGSTVDARGVTTPFTISSTITITEPMNVWLPCTIMTFTVQPFIVEADDVHIHTCGNGSTGQVDQGASSNSATQLVASGGFNSNVITVQKSGSRSSIATARISGFSLDPLFINMNSLGNRAIYLSSCWHCTLTQPTVINADCSDGVIYQEGDPSSDGSLDAASYFVTYDRPWVQISSGNTSCHPYVFDARYGEVAYGYYNGTFGGGTENSTGSGSDLYLIEAGSGTVDGFDESVFVTAKGQNPVSSSYGVNLSATGNYNSQSGGRIFDVVFIHPQMERLFGQSSSGTGIGCSSSGSPSGTGCGAITIINPSMGNWSTNLDFSNLGTNPIIENDDETPSVPALRFVGTTYGSNNTPFYVNSTLVPSGNTQTLYGGNVAPSFNDEGDTSQTAIGLNVVPTLSGTAGHYSVWEALHVDGSAVTGGVGIHVANSTALFDGNITGGRHIQQESSGNFAGTCVFASMNTCSISYSVSFTSTPILVFTPVNPSTVTFTLTSSSNTGFTLTASTSNSLTVNWLAIGNPN